MVVDRRAVAHGIDELVDHWAGGQNITWASSILSFPNPDGGHGDGPHPYCLLAHDGDEGGDNGSRVSVVGIYGPPWNLVPIGVAMNKNLTIRTGQCNVKKYMPRLVELIRSGAIDPRQIITHRLPLSDGPAGYRLLERKLNGAVKCVLLPS